MNRITSYVALTLVVAAGCGGPAHEYDAVVTGTVTIDGELAKSGIVTFHPIKDGNMAIGRIHSDGSYSLRTGQGDLREVDGGTVAAGEYIVTISITGPPVEGARVAEGGPSIPGPSLVAAKYATKQTSDLKRTVKAGSQVINLELERAAPRPPAEQTPEGSASEPENAPAAEGSDAKPAVEEPDHAAPAEAASEESTATGESTVEKSAEAAKP